MVWEIISLYAILPHRISLNGKIERRNLMENVKMPVIFVGHGSPMNAISDNEFTRSWERLGKILPKPTAILVISAHWYDDGTYTNDKEHPEVINDMYGFPNELYQVNYNSPGSPFLANRLLVLLKEKLLVDNSWGIDHGTWSVLTKMYPNKNIPVIQLSINRRLFPQEHYEIGVLLKTLREEGVLIIGSGNIVHNLMMVDWYNGNNGFAWAESFDSLVKKCILEGNDETLIDYKHMKDSSFAIPTPEHYLPLLYVLGASNKEDKIEIFNEKLIMGSLSMTSYIFWPKGIN